MKSKESFAPQFPEQELDSYIDALNMELKPLESTDSEVAELQFLTRNIKSLRPAPELREKFSQELQANLQKSLKPPKRFLPWSGLVAGILVLVFLLSPWSHKDTDIVLAMGQKVKQLNNYHGVLEKVITNAEGQRQVIQKTEIWSEGDKYSARSEDGLLTVNNGEEHWTVNPVSQEITLLPSYLDPHDFDLREEAKRAEQYPHKVVGQETISGHTAARIEITPPGGLAYYLWIDTETQLPLQLMTAMQKSLQTTYTFVSLETNISIPPLTFDYNPPQGYQVVNQNPDKLVADITEAIALSGLTPLQVTEKPQKIYASAGRIVFDFTDTVVSEEKAATPLKLSPLAARGKAAGSPLEILPDSLRWQQNGLEIHVKGRRAEEVAKQITKDILFPEAGQDLGNQPSIPVEPDMEIVKNNQQQVDSGSSPWQLDPLQVAYTFAALQISPAGIQGESPLDYASLQVETNTGTDAVVQIKAGPVKTVYLKRLIRQDTTGIWTVVGYDPR